VTGGRGGGGREEEEGLGLPRVHSRLARKANVRGTRYSAQALDVSPITGFPFVLSFGSTSPHGERCREAGLTLIP